jgi:hypothetical protein
MLKIYLKNYIDIKKIENQIKNDKFQIWISKFNYKLSN